jgi:hypothetical protein
MSHLPSSRAGRHRAAGRSFTFRGGAIALVIAGAVGLTACGGSSGSSATSTTTATSTGSTATTTPTGGAATNAAFAKYTACLKQHGVTLPGPGAGGAPGAGGGAPPTTGGSAPPSQPPAGGFNSAKFQKAQTACAGLRPKGARTGGPGFGGGQNSAAFAAYRNCLTIHGVKASSLRPGNGGTATASAKVRKAMTACASLQPARANGPASTSTTPSQ